MLKLKIKYKVKLVAILNIIFCMFALFVALSFAGEEFVYDSKGKRNPFIPLVDSGGKLINLEKEDTGASSDLSVDGIIFDKQGVSYCIVNGAVVGLGDNVGDYRVLKIMDNKVVFIKDGLMREIEISKKEVE